MSISRRDFMNVFGVTVASFLLSRCKWEEYIKSNPFETPTVLCYAPVQLTPTSTPLTDTLPARERLRISWLSFGEVAQNAVADSNQGSESTNSFRQELADKHRAALDELVAAGSLSKAVADLIQEAYDAAIYHVWRSSAPITCYIAMGPYYAPESAEMLIKQAETLNQIASQGSLDQETLAKARAALEHDLAFYSLSEADLQVLYKHLSENGQSYPPFEEVELAPTPEAQAAAEFIIELLTQK